MAELDLTEITEAVVEAEGIFADFEGRFSDYGIYSAFAQGTRALVGDKAYNEIIATRNQHNAQEIAIPTLVRETINVLTARSCEITGQRPLSAKPIIPEITRGFEIKIYPKVNLNNHISKQRDFAWQFANGIRSVAPQLDAYGQTILEAKKNTALKTVGLDGVNIVGAAYQIDPEYNEELYAYIRVAMKRNLINSASLYNITNTEALANILKYESLGESNAKNIESILNGTAPSAVGKFRHTFANELTQGAGIQETHYVAPFGSLGVFVTNDSDAINKEDAPDDGKLYTVYDPITGITWDVLEQPICSDLSAAYGNAFKRTMGKRYQFAANFGFFTAYSSTAESPIIKFELLKTVA